MKRTTSLFAVFFFTLASFGATRDGVRKQLFDSDWSFSSDSSSWKSVDLPHDWSIEGAFNRDAPAGNDGAYLPTGTGRTSCQTQSDSHSADAGAGRE